MRETEKEKEELKNKIIEITSIDPIDKKAILTFLKENGCKMDKYTNKALQEILDSTHNKLFEMLLQYNKNIDKLIKLNSFYSNMDIEEKKLNFFGEEEIIRTAYISPVFALNSKETISISKPSFPFPIKDIKGMLSYNWAIQLNSLEEITEFLRRYRILINVEDKIANFLIINTTIYLNLTDLIDLDIVWDLEYYETQKGVLLKELVKKYGIQQPLPRIYEEIKKHEESRKEKGVIR